MADRTVSMIVQVGGAVRNSYLRAVQTAEERQRRLTGALEGTKKQLGAVASAQTYERRLAALKRQQDAAGDSSEDLAAEIRRTEAQYDAARRGLRRCARCRHCRATRRGSPLPRHCNWRSGVSPQARG